MIGKKKLYTGLYLKLRKTFIVAFSYNFIIVFSLFLCPINQSIFICKTLNHIYRRLKAPQQTHCMTFSMV